MAMMVRRVLCSSSSGLSVSYRYVQSTCRRSFSSVERMAKESTSTRTTTTTTTTTTPYVPGESTHFGFQQVPTFQKEARVREVFENVAESYDVMNDFMSGGLHRLWKDYFVDQTKVSYMTKAALRTNQELKILDVAGGTGDIAFRMATEAAQSMRSLQQETKRKKNPVSITICDINPEMLRVGERRANERFRHNNNNNNNSGSPLETLETLSFQEGNAQSLSFQDDVFDLYTIAFGLRNVTDVDLALREACRVIKPGGRYMCLEFSQVPDAMLRQIYDAYSFRVIPWLGDLVANDRPSYQYLVESIRKFSNQEELQARMEQAGFQHVKYTNLTGGIVAMHQGWKPL